MKTVLSALVVLVAAASVAAEVAQVRKCPGAPADACTVSDLSITPCKKKDNICGLKKGANHTLAFKFTPNFSATHLNTSVAWPSPTKGEMIFDTVGIAYACPYTTCPTTAGTQYSFEYNLYLGKKLPSGNYPLRWRIWNTDNVNDLCCLETTINLKPSKNRRNE